MLPRPFTSTPAFWRPIPHSPASIYLFSVLLPPGLTRLSAVGWLTGDQALQSAGNAEAAKATAAFKQARSDKVIDPPVPSLEGLTGMKESVMGMLTGDQDRQSAGNVQGSKATLRDGI